MLFVAVVNWCREFERTARALLHLNVCDRAWVITKDRLSPENAKVNGHLVVHVNVQSDC